MRMALLSCYRSAMDITLKLPDDLCCEARQRATDESKSLSAWVADLVAREIQHLASKRVPATLLDALGDESLADGELDLPDRRSLPQRHHPAANWHRPA